MSKKALIFGMSGQAGYYLAKLLRSKGYVVRGTFNTNTDIAFSAEANRNGNEWYHVDLSYRFSTEPERIIANLKPDEIYNLASEMFAPASWDRPVHYAKVNFVGTLRMLETYHRVRPDGRFFQAGSAEVFGAQKMGGLSEKSEMKPRNPYGVAKLAAQEMVRVYRENYHMYACTGILFNMESPRRPKTFFSTKVAHDVARVRNGELDKIRLGKLSARRDWGLTEEFVEAMWRMLQAYEPRDFVIGTGVVAGCDSFVWEAMRIAGVSPDKLEYDREPGPLWDTIGANPSLIKRELGWEAKTTWKGVVKELMEAELQIGQSALAR